MFSFKHMQPEQQNGSSNQEKKSLTINKHTCLYHKCLKQHPSHIFLKIHLF